MPPRTAVPAQYPPEAFELFAHFPKYPTSGSRADQLAFIADMLDEEPPFPQEVHDLWCNFHDEYPVFAPKEKQEEFVVRTMRKWRLGPVKELRRRVACEIEMLKIQVAQGAEAVQLIRPDFERIRNFETKLAELIDYCVEYEQVTSIELQVCGGVYQSLEFLDRQLTLIFAGNPSRRYGGSGVPRRREAGSGDARQRAPHQLHRPYGNHALQRRRVGPCFGPQLTRRP